VTERGLSGFSTEGRDFGEGEFAVALLSPDPLLPRFKIGDARTPAPAIFASVK